MASSRSRPGGDVHTSNQASASSSAAPAVAGRPARGLPRVSSNAVSRAAAASARSGPTQAGYHLRVLADAGIIEEVTERAHGRERWWRTIPADLREPDYDSLGTTATTRRPERA